MGMKKIRDFKFDKGWKLLIYFDYLLPALIYLIAFLTQAPFAAKLFHSYEMFIVSPIPNFSALTGIIGLIYHIGIIGYTIKKRYIRDIAVSLLLTLLTVAMFTVRIDGIEINYFILQPLRFASF